MDIPGEMTKAKCFKKDATRSIRVAKESSAREAIGALEHGTDTFILTFGQFSLIEALVAILDQTGPADVVIATWTAADAHLERSRDLLESAAIRSLRWIVDRGFESRQPKYCYHMRQLFGADCIRAIRTHAKFILVRNEEWSIVVRTSMNLNDNPRLEDLEITDHKEMAEFFQRIADDIFSEVEEGRNQSELPLLEGLEETVKLTEVRGNVIARDRLNEPRTTHVVRRAARRSV
jgi:3-dehydroquinate synthase class II